MLIPAAAIGARCSSRTLFSIMLSTFWLKEKILKTEYLSVRTNLLFLVCVEKRPKSFFQMLLCIIGVGVFVTDSLLTQPLINESAFSLLSNTWIVVIGFRKVDYTVSDT